MKIQFTLAILLGWLLLGPVPPASAAAGDVLPRPLTSQGLTNLTALTRLIGYVRFFHPSDQVAGLANADWDALAMAGVERVEAARNPGPRSGWRFSGPEPHERQRFLMDALDRPIRVCGVVRNQGEPGGGPFWVESPSGGISPQIVEASQIDPKSPEQREILESSTHFNPVDIVCGLRDRLGHRYDLHRYVDPSTVFIAEKSHEGRPLKALERPGLWNGAMAGWNTVFVEVPDATFAPVKTVLDLLRDEHQ